MSLVLNIYDFLVQSAAKLRLLKMMYSKMAACFGEYLQTSANEIAFTILLRLR